MKFKILLLALITAFAASACDKKEETAPATPAATVTEAAAVVAATEVVPAESVSADTTGVAECDEYLEKVMACYEDKVPEAMRGAMVDGLNQMKAAWTATPADQKGALADSCKQALDGSREALKAYGCTL